MVSQFLFSIALSISKAKHFIIVIQNKTQKDSSRAKQYYVEFKKIGYVGKKKKKRTTFAHKTEIQNWKVEIK